MKTVYLSPVSGHRQFAGVVCKHEDQIWISQHTSMPFGAVASVHAWDRVGAFFRELGRKLFHLVLFRYVDDFFAVDWEDVIENAKEVFARLVQACLGSEAISARKLEAGNGLVILGVVITFTRTGVTFWPSEDKIRKWIERITLYLERGSMTSGEASKLSGASQWACQECFKKLGRAMLRPIINHIRLVCFAFAFPLHVCMLLTLQD